jgi:E3 SUMO-protein ligase PIAS1
LGSRRENRAVELRCIKLDGKHGAEEPTWPDVGDLAVNGKRILEFKPL